MNTSNEREVRRYEVFRKSKREEIVDTRKYRYAVDSAQGVIKRLPIEYLDTTLALTEWEVVANL